MNTNTINTNTTKEVKEVKEWKPNQAQQAFLDTLKNYPNGATLSDIFVETGVNFKTGSINSLSAKGLVKTTETERMSDIVYRGVVIGTKTDKVKKYYLA